MLPSISARNQAWWYEKSKSFPFQLVLSIHSRSPSPVTIGGQLPGVKFIRVVIGGSVHWGFETQLDLDQFKDLIAFL